MTRLILCLLLGIGFSESADAEDGAETMKSVSDVGTLLSHLDLDAPGLEEVKKAAGNPEAAARKLLAYYRSRDSVKHSVDREQRSAMLGKSAGKKNLEVADNALQHIFVGQRNYPPHFCGEDINWNTRPVPDKAWVHQLNRMYFWNDMALAYWHTGDEKYAREWCAQLLDWTKKNPRDKKHHYAWGSIQAGIRGRMWTGLFQRFLDSPSFTPDVLTAFLNSCHDHGSFLMTTYRKGSNWALMEAEGLAFIAITFPEFRDATKWRDEAIRRFNLEINRQVNADGYQRELAISYHIGAIGWFMRILDLANMNGQKDAFPPSYLQTIEKMCAVVMKLGLPDGSKTQFGDSWTGKPGDNWTLLARWAKLFDRQDFLYLATDGREGEKPDATAFALPQSGFYSMRSGWERDAICLVLKCGPDGGFHCQPDNGTFELFAGKRNLMPDSGVYIYHGDAKNRAWFRKTSHHQTLTLNGENSAYAPTLLLWKPGKDVDTLVVENGSYKDLKHRRAVFFVDKTFFILVDEAIGTAAGDIDLHFQLAPGKAVFDNASNSVRTDFADGWNVLVRSLDQKGMRLQEEQGQVSFVYTQKEPRPAFRYRLRKEKDQPGVRFVTLVVPYSGKVPELEVKIIGEPAIGARRIELDVLKNGVSKRIGYDLPQ